ncbi:MAG: hypothetical protein J07HX5_01858, partial [halophilic archaeon J07HX5]
MLGLLQLLVVLSTRSESCPEAETDTGPVLARRGLVFSPRVDARWLCP